MLYYVEPDYFNHLMLRYNMTCYTISY